MKWSNRKKLPFEKFFSTHLKPTTTELHNKKQKNNQKRNHNPNSHIEQIQRPCNNPSKCKRSTIPHKHFSRINIIKHKSPQNSHTHTQNRSRNIGMIEQSSNRKHNEHTRTSPTSESIQPISNINSIYNEDCREKGQNREEKSDLYFACQGPKIDVINPQFQVKPIRNSR